MSIDFEKLQLSARNNSMKLLQQGSGTLNVPSGTTTPGGNNNTEATTTIAHNYGSDQLLVQVSIGSFLGEEPGWVIPYVNPPGTIWIFPHLNSTNLYITGAEARPTGVPADGYSVQYHYRIFIP